MNTNWLLLPQAIIKRYGFVANCEIDPDGRSGRLFDWSHPTLPEPTQAELEQLLLDYEGTAIDRLKADRKREVDQLREQYEFSTFEWNGEVWQSDRDSTTRISGAVLVAQMGYWQGTWKTADNQEIELDSSQIVALGLTLFAHVSKVHTDCQNHKKAIDSLESIEAVAAYDLSAGWG
ncbi:DUF4376 domain-containing protein [Oculatella sp. LEGE 06141]|uniref:DUF4376 domain-containing protein n=1 Tax=Oculatella sp. LEGE 06141 TaxID=1828648 RepID=UPI00187E45F6|nr:DUF4376 domain-containing protein [Oculatella sp. LEGE 06141]MBE9178583.1 DUF4376 domain-containing protein [Oculatella sp. LEGE 06141]